MNKIFIWSAWWAEHSQTLYQSTIVYEFFKQNWYELVKEAKDADYILLNGYPFDLYEEKISLLHIYYYLNKYKNKKIIIFWSIPDMIFGIRQLKKEFKNLEFIWYSQYYLFDKYFKKKKSINEVDGGHIHFFVPLKIESISLGDLLHNKLGDNLKLDTDYEISEHDLKISVDSILDGSYKNFDIEEYSWEYNYLEDNEENYYLEATHGCWFDCAYCAIKRVYWYTKSYSLNYLLNKIKNALNKWVKNIIFIDEDVWSYGIDIWLNFSDLINSINNIKKEFNVKFYYLEPKHFLDYFYQIDRDFWLNRLTYARITLQTTSQRILNLMNRDYDIDQVLKLSQYLKLNNPKLELWSIVIYWYPTETFGEFKDYFRLINIYDCTDFLMYAPKKWTKSYNLKRNSFEEILKKNLYLLKMKQKYKNKIDPVVDWLKDKLKIIKTCYL